MYEAPTLTILGSIETMTQDGQIIKVGTESDMFSSLAPITGSNVHISSDIHVYQK